MTKNTALVGTVRKQRTFLPTEFQINNKIVGSKFLFSGKNTLVHFTDKPGKSVILMSSLHHSPDIEENGKPEIVNYYNETKAGVDTLDQIIRFFTVRRKSLRWPMTIFYNIIDIVGYNSFVIYSMKYPEDAKKDKWRARRRFLLQLAEEIMEEYKVPEPDQKRKKLAETATNSRARCSVCPRDKDTKSRYRCHKCTKPMCLSHMNYVCPDCDE